MVRNSLRKGLICCLFIPFMVYAKPPQWIIEPSESQLSFTGTQNGAPVTGTFKTFTGTLYFDANALSESSVAIIVDIDSLDTAYADVKKMLLTSDWFDAHRFPKAEFKSTQIKKTAQNGYEAMGTLRIRDQSAPVTLSFTVEERAPNKRFVMGNTLINRNTFGVGQGEWASTKEIKDEVTIQFKVVATIKPS